MAHFLFQAVLSKMAVQFKQEGMWSEGEMEGSSNGNSHKWDSDVLPASSSMLYYRCTACCECFFLEEEFLDHAKFVHCKVLVCQGHDPDEETEQVMLMKEDSNGMKKQNTRAADIQEDISGSGSRNIATVLPVMSFEGASANIARSFFSATSASQVNFSSDETSTSSSSSDDTSNAINLDEDNDPRCVVTTAADNKVMNMEEEETLAELCEEGISKPVFPVRLVSSDMCDDSLDMNFSRSHAGKNKRKARQPRRAVKTRPALLDDVEMINCNRCGQRLSSRNELANHDCSCVDEKLYSCNMCSKTFKHENSLKMHKTVHSRDKQYRCDVCNVSFKYPGSLQKHFSVCRQIQGMLQKACSSSIDGASENSVSSAHQSTQSSTATGDNSNMGISSEAVLSDVEALEMHNPDCITNIPSCDQCGAIFQSQTEMKTHMAMHIIQKLYQCNICQKEFTNASLLRAHHSMHSMKQYTCNMCSLEFHSQSALSSHQQVCLISVTSTRDKKHKCGICGVEFRQETTLTAHLQTHLETKSHKCDVCGAAFKQHKTLIQHFIIVHKKFTCEQCGSKFDDQAEFETHKKFHNNTSLLSIW